MNNPFDYTPDEECRTAFRKLCDRLDALKKSDNPADINFCRELDEGKMLGVLIASDADGNHHTLFAFSGQLGHVGFHYPGFVGPVFDYLHPGGYFKIHEAEISRQNEEITLFQESPYGWMKGNYDRIRKQHDTEIAEYKERCRLSKLERDAQRDAGTADENEMIRQSQFEKAELQRLKKKLAAALKPVADDFAMAQSQLESMKAIRHVDSENLQNWLFSNFKLPNARGESKSLGEIFAETPLKVPPSGAGECCGPKLLNAAYMKGWQPLSMAEYWYGKPKGGELRIHGSHYPACRGKCLPVLSWMLQGLSVYPPLEADSYCMGNHSPEIIFENEWFCVIDKPSGMLSVPGKGAAVSAEEWLLEKYGPEHFVKMVHRLDQDTSGLLIAALSPVSFKVLQTLFAMRGIKKTYVADLEGDYEVLGLPRSGRIDLPISPDWLDRPRQRVDFEMGKEGITDYEFTDVSDGRSRVFFHPHTGRTHQLRVHSASEKGLGMPITGDRLYGKDMGRGANRLHLHAFRLEFTFPIDRKHYTFESPNVFSD